MKNLIAIISILILTSCRVDNNQHITNLDFKAVEEYFKLIDHLESKNELTDEQWNHFLKIKGNRMYIEENNIPIAVTENLRKIIIDVYSPNKSDDSLKSNNDIFYQIRNKYRDNDSLYRNHIIWLKNNKTTIIDSMISRTIKFLPENKLTKDSLPPIYYHALDHDGSANKKGLFISIMATYENNIKRLANFEAHEFHHIQRSNILEKIKVDSTDMGLIWSLNAVLNEGLADMVDKDVMLSKESDWWLKEMVNDFYIGKSEEVLINLDKLISDESKGIHHSEEEYRNCLLSSVGHVPGYWMAKVVVDNGKAQEMIKNANNPFSFFFLYNEIALNNPTVYKALSNSSISYLKVLQNKY